MRRHLALATIGVLAFTGCTDQPAAEPPSPTETVTETVTAPPPQVPPSQERLVDMLAEVLETDTLQEQQTGSAAVEALHVLLVPDAADEDLDSNCELADQPQPETAAFDAVASDEDDSETRTALTALGFEAPEEAVAFTEHIQEFTETCKAADYHIEPLTHHTDEAFEIRLEDDEEANASVVMLRNQHWVLAAASTPPADVSLSLTLIDQLDEMLR